MSRQAFVRVEATRHGFDAWLGVAGDGLDPDWLLGWLQAEIDLSLATHPLQLAAFLEDRVGKHFPHRAYFVEAGWHKRPFTYQLYGDGK